MNASTMVRGGFVPYGPAGAGVEALSRVMAADLEGTNVTVNLLLPGGATDTGMIPDDVSAETRAALLDPAVMGPPIVWLASPEASFSTGAIFDSVVDPRFAASSSAAIGSGSTRVQSGRWRNRIWLRRRISARTSSGTR